LSILDAIDETHGLSRASCGRSVEREQKRLFSEITASVVDILAGRNRKT
jgi:hypothetical protein